jgi:uracil-DNA glycosylase
MNTLINKWALYLNAEFEKPYYKELSQFLTEEYDNATVYPNQVDLFNALTLTDYDDVKVVILGQDPYHGPNQAHGLSFSVNPNVPIPPSLLNIYKEIQTDLNCYIPNNGCLTKWAKQGVLLLNTSLSVREGHANSHQKIGWHLFTSKIVELLDAHETPIVFMLWGKNAQEYAKLISNPKHLILTAPHPSPLSAYRGFFGCRHFSQANDFLRTHALEPIDWQIESL